MQFYIDKKNSTSKKVLTINIMIISGVKDLPPDWIFILTLITGAFKIKIN